jgi:hypothetical protein
MKPSPHRTAAVVLGATGLALLGCSSSALTGEAGLSSGGRGGRLAYRPCDPANHAGGFAVQLIAARPEDDPPTPASAVLTGKVLDRADPRELWRSLASEAGCRVAELPPLICNPSCPATQICETENRCTPEPARQEVGEVTLTGLPGPVKPILKSYHASFPAGIYPPYAADAEVRLMVLGGPYGPFSLAGRGIPPLSFMARDLRLVTDQPLALSWDAPAPEGSARIEIALDIAHHGNIGARIDCDVADSGSHAVPGALITRLIALGTAGFPTVTLTRRTVDSTSIAPGCVQLAIASSVEQPLEVDGVISCNEDRPCPGGRPCGRDLKCR